METIDRTEFIKRLDQSFDVMSFYSIDECVRALIFNDTAFIDALKAKVAIHATEKQKWIDQYDAAPDKADKDAVIGSVTLKNIV